MGFNFGGNITSKVGLAVVATVLGSADGCTKLDWRCAVPAAAA